MKEFGEGPFAKLLHSLTTGLYGLSETKYHPPSQEEISRDTEKQYPEWLESVRQFLVRLPQHEEYPGRHVTISVILANSGTIPATNLSIKLEALGGLFLIERRPKDESNRDQQKLEFPSPPTPPKGKWVRQIMAYSSVDAVQQAMGMVGMARSPRESIVRAIKANRYPEFFPKLPLDIPKPRDPNAFYWKEGRLSESAWVFQCQEFLHKIRPKVFDIDLFIPGDKVRNCAVQCLVTASNLAEPVRITVPINVEFRAGDIEEIADHILSNLLPLIRLGRD